ncbi:MAG: leucine-rich repeat protein, partial [Clostridia bacterium]|nr:leucine-rich repeat protein [Clostridia bacterium]
VCLLDEVARVFPLSATPVALDVRPGGRVSIGNDVFYDCSKLTTITIPDSVTSIGVQAFSGCNSLQYNEYDNAKYLGNDSNPYVALIKAKSKDFTTCSINDNTRVIAYNAFSQCKSLSSITIPDSVTSIGYDAFNGCSSLTSINIPDNVTSIGSNAFNGCSSLTSITIPDSVTSIGEYVFYNCSSLKSVEIGNSVTSIGDGAFNHCSKLESITVSSGNKKYHSSGNCLIDTETKTLIKGCRTSVIPNDGSVTSIGYSAFSDCSQLTSITIPGGVTSIGSTAFFGCSSLASITIPDSVTSIGSSAFYGCSSLTSVTIGNGVTSIGYSAFYKCSSLEIITVSDGNTKYHSSGNCVIDTEEKKLILGCKGSVIPSDGSVKSIGSSAFYGCSSLTSITIPEGVTSIGSSAFYGCSQLTSVTIPVSVTSIGSSTFSDCERLTDVYYHGSESEWNEIQIYNYGNERLINANKHYQNHSWELDSDFTVWPTYVSDGELTYVCSACGRTKTETIPHLISTIIGDVDGDGVINMKDIAEIKVYLAGDSANALKQNCDINGDGVINMLDISALKVKIAG